MSTDSRQQAVSLAQADRAAQQSFEPQSIDSPVAPCPAMQKELFIVPARYALSEVGAEHHCVQPGVTPRSHPVALRRLRTGYLYLWHGEGPLRRFGIAKDGLLVEQALDAPAAALDQGAQAGLTLDKQHSARLMYAEIPLPQAVCELLSKSQAERSAHMRSIPLPQIATSLETSHCPALADATTLVAELMPEIRDKALAHDYYQNGDAYRSGVASLGQQMMSDPTPVRVQAYVDASTWLHEREQASHRHPDAADLAPGYWSSVEWDVPAAERWIANARSEAGALHAVFTAADDVLGILRDLNAEQTMVSHRQYEWDEANAHKGLIAGFINSLINEDGAELSSLINYRYREQDIQLTPAQGEELLKAQRELRPLIDEETRTNRDVRRTDGHRAADVQLARIHAQQQQVLQPVREFIPANLHGHIQGVVLNYRAAKARNLSDHRTGAQVAERVRLDAMNDWIANVAEPHRAWVANRREVLFQDARSFLPKHGEASWFVHYDDPEHCDWLSELALNTLSELCTAGPGVKIATDLLRSPTPERPLSLTASAFTPELSDFVAGATRLTEIEAVLTADNAELAGKLLERLAGPDKLNWLQGLGGPDGSDWGRAVSRLATAFVELEADQLKGATALPPTIQHFPPSLLSLMLVLKTSADMALKTGRTGYRLSGPLGQAVWDWSSDAASKLRLGLASQITRLGALNAYGGALSLVALLLHGVNLAVLRDQGAWRERNDVRQMEYLSTALNTAAALSAVILNVANAREMLEVSVRRARLPLVTLLGFVTGAFAGLAGFFELRQLISQQRKEDAYWSADEWGRALRGSGQTALATTYMGLGGYSTYMVLAGRWDAAQATKWFIRGSSFVGWAVLLIEGLYFAWRYYTHRTDMQRFLEQCCWGNQRRWSDSADDQSREFQVLIDMLFMPQLSVDTTLTSRQIGGSGNQHLIKSRIDRLSLVLPGASLDTSRVGIKLAAVTPGGMAEDVTDTWIKSATCEWLPMQQGMGLKLSGAVAAMTESQHLEVRVLYHSPLAMLAGTLGEGNPVVGGRLGMRYLIRSGNIIGHTSTDGPLPSDRLPIRHALSVDATLQLRIES